MKKQRFYPVQVVKQLNGRAPESLSEGEKCALSFFVRKGRKFGLAIGIFDGQPIAIHRARQ